mmetsp:Transcript_17136/g.30704  ORF Transcript_17136/g.30704 Transcript_17136/m.30704 type:complete len:104 (-) Transcript_17136:1754-2065(-)
MLPNRSMMIRCDQNSQIPLRLMREECQTTTGNSIRHKVLWKENRASAQSLFPSYQESKVGANFTDIRGNHHLCILLNQQQTQHQIIERKSLYHKLSPRLLNMV